MAHRRRAAAVLALATFLLPAGARADYILGPPEVNSSLKKMTLLRRDIDAAADRRAKAEALFALATAATELSALINREVASHGFDQKPLIELAVARSAAIGVAIAFDAAKERYFYDRAAYTEYLKVAPSGPRAPDARFMIVEQTFYAQKRGDRAGVERLIGDIEALRPRYRDEIHRPELELFLAVLYQDLSAMKAGEAGGGREERGKAERLCEALIAKYPSSPEAKVAAAMLKRLKPAQ